MSTIAARGRARSSRAPSEDVALATHSLTISLLDFSTRGRYDIAAMPLDFLSRTCFNLLSS